MLVNFSKLGISVRLSAIVNYDSNIGSFFAISNKSLRIRIGSATLKLDKLRISFETRFNYASTTVRGFVALTNNAVAFGMSVVHNFIHNNKRVYLGLKLTVQVSFITLGVLAATAVGIAVIVPQLAPVFAKLAATVISLVSNPAGLTTATTGVVMMMKAYA